MIKKSDSTLPFPYLGKLFSANGSPLSSVETSMELLTKVKSSEIPSRFTEGVVVSAVNGCWYAPRYRNHAGYVVGGDGREGLLHRWVATNLSESPLSVGQQGDHLCRHRACFCPLHIEGVTPIENNRRMVAMVKVEKGLRNGQLPLGLEEDWLSQLVRGDVQGRVVCSAGTYEFENGLPVLVVDPAELIIRPQGKKSYRPVTERAPRESLIPQEELF